MGVFDSFRQKIISAISPQEQEDSESKSQTKDTVDNLISLGVLLWEVAQADDKFLPEEEAKIGEVLNTYGHVTKEDMPIVLRAIKEASIARIDLHTFTKEVGQDLAFDVKIGILENLFRVACIDQDLDNEEHEMIRKISGLLRIEHKDFIDIKIRIKKEFGLDTAGF